MRLFMESSSYQYQKRPVDFLNYHLLDFNEYQGCIAASTAKTLSQPRMIQYYPLVDQEPILSELSQRFRIPIESLALANGADDALFHSLLMAKMRLNRSLARVFFHPSYSHSACFMKTLGFEVLPFEDPDHFSDSDRQIIYLSFPNNPTGEDMSPDQLSHLLNRFQKSLWLVDLTYILYSRYSLKDYIKIILSSKQSLAMMSFSKAFPLAGLRMAFIWTSAPQLLSYFQNEYNKKTIGSVARAVALDCLKNWDFYEEQRKQIWSNRSFLAGLLEEQACRQKLQLGALKSEKMDGDDGGNFFCLSGPREDRERFVQYLYSKKIIIRCKKDWDFLRVTSVCDKILNQIQKKLK